MARKDPQLNVRLTPQRDTILRAAAFVHGAATPGELAREIIEQAIDRYAESPTVKKALEARAEQAAASEGRLSHLPERAERA
jgi:hypothetical protein